MANSNNNDWRSKVKSMMTDPDYAEKMASAVDTTRKINTDLMNKSAENYPALSLTQPTQKPLDLSRVEDIKAEEVARAMMPTEGEEYSGVADLATRLYAEERDRRGKEAMQRIADDKSAAFASPMATAINRVAEIDKATNVGQTYDAVMKNEVLIGAVRANANKALVKALEQNQSMTEEEQQRVYEDAVKKQMEGIESKVNEYLLSVNAPKSEAEYIAKSAINNSIIGKAVQGAARAVAGDGGEFGYEQQALADYDANKATWWGQGLGVAAGLALDAPIMQGIGLGVNATIGRGTMWGLGKIGGRALQNSILGKVTMGMATGGGVLGGYNAVSTLQSQLMGGYFKPSEIASSTGHGFLLGGLTGGMTPWLRGMSANMGKVGKVGTMAGGLATEAGIFTASELSEMDNPYDLETIAKAFGKNVAVIGGLKVSNLPKTISEYKGWYNEGKQSNFSDADYKVMADFAKANGYANEEAFTMNTDGTYKRSIADRVTGNRTLLEMTKLQGGKEHRLAIDMFSDPNVPLSLKTKIAAKMGWQAPAPVLANGVRVEGNKAITYYTLPDGRQQVIEIKEFKRPRNARAFANEFGRTTARRNDLLQSEAFANEMASEPIILARLNEQAKRNGTSLEEETAKVDAIFQRLNDGTITKEDVAYYNSIFEGDATATDAIKETIKAEQGVDIDEVLRKEGSFTDAEDKALTAYGNALRGIIEKGNPTTERMAVASTAGVADYVVLNNLDIMQTTELMANPERRAEVDAQMRGKYAAWLKFFDGKMGEDALAERLGYNLDNTSDLQSFLAEQSYFKTKAADRIASRTVETAKAMLENGGNGVRFTEDGKVKLKGVPYAVEVSEDIVARYEAAMNGSGEPMSRIVNDALKDIIKQGETPMQPKEQIAEETADVEQPMTENEAITQQMVDARLAEIDTDLQGIQADGVQKMTINGQRAMVVKGRIVADINGQVDKTKSSTEVAYMLLDENGRPILDENGRPKIEVGVKPSNVHVEDIEPWRRVDEYKASEEQRIRENNRITDEAMRQADEQMAVEEQPTEQAREIIEPQTTEEMLQLCNGDKELAIDVATDELNRAMQSKGKGATPAETMEINKRIRMYQQMLNELSRPEQPVEAPKEQVQEPQVTEDMEFVYQQGLDENHDGMEPMQTTDGRYKWVGLQRGELTANMGEKDVELLDNLAKKLGVAVIPINVADRAVNGYYRDGNIYVNTNRGAEWTMRWVAGHEMLHDVAKKSPDAYNAYKQAVLDMWGEEYVDNQVKQIIEDYKASGKTIDREQALTELVNDFGGELFNSRDGLGILDNILKTESSKGNVGFVDTIKQWWEKLKEWFSGTPYYSEIEKKLTDAYESAMKVMADRMGERKVVEQQELVTIGGLKDEAVADDAISNEGAEMSIVRDRNKIDELEGKELVPMLRTFQIFDGRLYPPMAAVQGGKKVHSVMVGDWWKSDENPDKVEVKIKGSKAKTGIFSKDDDRISKKDGQWVITIDGEDKPLSMREDGSLAYYFNLKKGEKGDEVSDDLDVAYNPYIHMSKSALNDQFKGAYLRPNLVLVEVLAPKSEIDGTNRYRADYAKDGIGIVPWNSGDVIKQAVAAGHPGREVALSRYAKIGRVFTNAEWADRIDEELAPYKDKITLPFITFPPEVLRGLANKGYKIEPPTSKKAQPYYEKWLKGEQPTDPNGGGGKPIDAEFSIKADKELEKKSLVGVHNLTEDNLRYALNLGGLANPSTAVIDKNIMGLEGFGDISLIMPKSLVAKSTGKNAGTFAGDGYTPRFPKGDVVKHITKEGEKAIMADYPGDDKFSKDFREAWQNYGNEYGGITPALYYMYKLENGGAKIVKAEAPKIKSKEHQRMIDKFGNKEWYELNDAEKQELVDYRKNEMIESLKGADKNMVDKVVNDFINSADPEDLAYKKLRMLKIDYKEQQRAGEIDYMATYRDAQDDVALAGEQAKFNRWLADKSNRYGIEDRIFRGYTASGYRKYAPMTLANISKVMKEQGRAGAETFMTKSPYSLRGKMLPVYKTLEQIKKNKSKLADTETYEKFRKEIGDEYNELILDISELPNVKYDDTHYILEDALLKGFDYAEKQAGIQISDAVRERISAFGNLLKEAPVKYFETKFERPVTFDEFVAAVVPKDINPELRKALADKGLAIEEYERGSEESRLEAVRRASDRDDVQFSVKGKRADESVLDYAKRMSEENASSGVEDADYSIVRNGKEYKNDGYTQRGNINLSKRANEAIEDGMTDIGKDNAFGRFIEENGLGEYDGEYHHVGQRFNTHYFARLNDGVTLASARKAYKEYLKQKGDKEIAKVLEEYPDAIPLDGGIYNDYANVAYAGGKFWYVPVDNNADYSIKRGSKTLEERLNSKRMQTRLNAAKELGKDYPEVDNILNDLEPSDINEVVAATLGSPDFKLRWEDKTGSKGLQKHLGLSDAEKKGFRSMISSNGYTPEEAAHQIWRNLSEEIAGKTDTMEILGIVLDYARSYTKRELREMIANNRIDTAIEYARKQAEWDAAQEQIYLEGLTEAERNAYLANKAEQEKIANMTEKQKAKYFAELQRKQMLDAMTPEERAEYDAKEKWRRENAGAIASSFFAERRADKADKIQALKDEINKLIRDTRAAKSEDSAKVKEIAKKMREFIEESIPAKNQDDMTNIQFKQVLAQLANATTRKDLEEPMRMVDYIGANVNRRALTRQMEDFLKKGFKGMTPKGLVKAKMVDGATSRVLGLTKSLYSAMSKQPLGSELRALQTNVRGIKAELEEYNEKNGGQYQEYVDQIDAILKKSGVDRHEEMVKYHNELLTKENTGEVLDYVARLLPELFNIELIKEQRTEAKINSALNTKEDLEQLKNSLADKEEKGILSEEDKAVMDNISLYELMIDLHQRQLDIDGPGASSIASQMTAKVEQLKEYRESLSKAEKGSAVEARIKTAIKQIQAEIDELFVQRTQAQKDVNTNTEELLANLKELRDDGVSKLQEWSKAKKEREKQIVTMANESFGEDARGYWSEVDRKGKGKRDFVNWLKNQKLAFLMSPAMSFEYMLGVMDPRYYTNESPIYNQFIKGSEGLIKANDNYFEGLESYNQGINEAVDKFIGRTTMTNLKDYFKRGDRFATEIIPFAFEVSENKDGEIVKSLVPTEKEMTRGQAAKIYAWSRMADGMAKLKAHGVTDDTMKKVMEFIGEDYMNFIDWVEDVYFPKLRREKYNPIYKQMYGISMAENEHYFPFLIYQKDVRKEQELEQPSNDKLGGGVVGNLVERTRNNARLDFTAESPDIFDMITEYGKKMEEWAAYAQVREDLKKVVNNKQFKQHCDMLGTHYYKYFLEAAQVASRLYNPQPSAPNFQKAASKAQKVFASAAISLRVSTALKQLLSAPAFVTYSLDPAFQHELIKTVEPIDEESAIKGLRELANGNKAEAKKLLLNENWVGHYNWCVENLPSFRERVAKQGAGNPILEERGFSRFSDDIQAVGMLPNRLVDAFTCSVGAKAIYEYTYQKFRKNYDEKTAHNMAVTEAEIAFNTSQQSSNPVFLAPMQASKEFWVRGMMNYKNSPIGFYRNGMKANIDLYRATKALIGQPKFTINGEEKGFESGGKKAISKAAEAAAKSMMFNFFLNGIWNFGTIGVAGLSYKLFGNSNDNGSNPLYTDEEIKKVTNDNMALYLTGCAIQGMPWFAGLYAAAQTGQDYSPSILFSEMNDYADQISKDGFMSMATAQLATGLLLKTGAGIDPEVWGQIYRGAQGIMADRPIRVEDFMNLIASPRSAISGVAKQKVGQYDNLQDYVNSRIESEREIGVNDKMTFDKFVTGQRRLKKSKLDGYIDEYLADKIPDYREIANKLDDAEKKEKQEQTRLLQNELSVKEYEKEKAARGKNKEEYDSHTKDVLKKVRKAVNVIHSIYAYGDAKSAQRIADELERRIKRGYNPDGATLDERLSNVDIYDSTGTTEQRSPDGYNTLLDRAMQGGFNKTYLGNDRLD